MREREAAALRLDGERAGAPQGGAAHGVAPTGVPPQGGVPQGAAQYGTATHGSAPQGVAPQGGAQYGTATHGSVRQSMATDGSAVQGVAPQSVPVQGIAPQSGDRPVTFEPARDVFGSGQPRAQRPGFDDLFAPRVPPAPASAPSAAYPAPAAHQPFAAPSRQSTDPSPQPTAPSHPTVAPSHPIPGTAAASPAPLRRTAHQTPLPTPEAEQTDRPVGRSSASAVSPRRDSDPGFDALFADLDDDEPDEAPRGNGSRPLRSGRPSRADRKAAKADKGVMAAKSAKGSKAAKPAKGGAIGPRRTGAMPTPPVSPAADLAALVGGAATSGSAASTAAVQATGAAAEFAEALSAAAGVRTSAPTPPSPSGPPAPSASPARLPSASPASSPSPSPSPTESRPPAPAPLTFDLPTRRDASSGQIVSPTDAASDLFGFVAEPADAAADLFGFATDPADERDGIERAAPTRAASTRAGSIPTMTASPTPTPTAAPTRRTGPSRAPGDRGSAAPQGPSRDARGVQRAARDAARSAGPRTKKVRVRMPRPQSRPATSAPVRRRGGRFLGSVVAMSFAALLAVATTIPSLSLLTPADVQALAMSSTYAPGPDGQRVELNGDIVAQSVQREGYASQTIEEYARAAGIRPEATFTNNPAGTIQWPFAVGVHIGDRFGYRDCWGCSSNHGGQDFNPGLGAEIQAIADGVVSVSTDAGGSLGVVIMIDHIIDGELITSVYAHMEYDSRRFEVGDTVYVGDVIGTTGDTGMSTGPHLHFEIRLGGVDGTKVDPLEWLYANTN